MFFELILYTSIATLATIMPVYKIKRQMAILFNIPVLGIIISLAYGVAVSWVLLNLFSFQSSAAGASNLLASILFTVWLWYENKKRLTAKYSHTTI